MAQAGALRHSEAVLLVDYHESKTRELHFVFDYSVGAYKNVKRAVGKAFCYMPSLRRLGGAGQQPHVKSYFGAHARYGFVVLGGQYLGGSHKAGLETVVNSQKHGHKCDKCFAAAHISLHKTVHLPLAYNVGSDFLDNSFLCSCKFKGKALRVKIVEPAAYPRHIVSGDGFFALSGASEDIDLNVKQLLEFKS